MIAGGALRAALERSGGDKTAAGLELGVSRDAVRRALNRLNAEAAGVQLTPGFELTRLLTTRNARGETTGTSVREVPERGDVADSPPSFLVTKRCIHRVGGEAVQSWDRESADEASRFQAIANAIEKRIKRVGPPPPIIMPRALGPASFLNQVTLADGHVGAMAWNTETGSGDWDLEIARQHILSGACWLMDALPPAEDLLLAVIGDFLDSDGYRPETPASKHLLDCDGRFPKIADVGCEIIEAAVLHGLTRYRTVRLVIKPGNHDPLSAMWMRKYFLRVFQDNPRVIVEPSLRPYWGMLFGKTMICTHHGDKATMGELPGIFAADFAEMWGKATYRVCHTGHLHHKHQVLHVGKELRGMMVYQHPTVSARNAWAADKGLAAARELVGHTYRIGGGLANTLHWQPELLGDVRLAA